MQRERKERKYIERELRRDRRLRGAEYDNKAAGIEVCPKEKLSIGLEGLE